MTNDLQASFGERFGGTARLYQAPGRVNLIGEHTDYNEGYVMPLAIDLACWIAIGSREDRILSIYSENLDDSVDVNLAGVPLNPSGNWSDYPVGIAAILQQASYSLSGANLYIRSEVPLGAGLSSSAAIEVAAGYALLHVSGYDVEPLPLALLCQRAENEFVGARCGIMDQFTACHGQSGKALLLDCRSLEYRALVVPENVALIVCNTKVKHALASGEYNRRRAECEEAVRLLAGTLSHVRALRDLTSWELEQNRELLTPTLLKRVRHVVTENERVQAAAAALARGDVGVLGELMRASHRSLRDDYEVSCSELDVMVEIAERQPGIYGSRMTGGGFGGCTINLVDFQKSKEFQHRVAEQYQTATAIALDIYSVRPSQGVGQLDAL
jgi:galactokinase